ncbi:GNAT family N-acetyltransferase [Microcella daejeonensis]|uniref:GNAT family N-acetyltransferase n=1 Tax=Microcella daejeonensis TaxID=2994971 RepID=A0A9E8S8Z7_9MICO|nr:GNAT family N-acetyltransferase [Microcella daejeonensis]WAB82145.1 GNAT family N-acetyltransferase [Microcella daejeonensis]
MLSIRPYEPRDADPTLDVLRAAITVTARADYSEQQARLWASRAARPGWHERRAAVETWVAELDGRVVGFTDRDEQGYIDMLFVHPEAGGRGVARALVERVIASAESAGLGRLTVHASLTARPVLLRMGFAPDPAAHDDAADGSRTVLIDGVAFTNFRLARPLLSGDAAPTS